MVDYSESYKSYDSDPGELLSVHSGENQVNDLDHINETQYDPERI